MHYKQPFSVLVVIHVAGENFLLLERVDFPDFWQSVTGSIEADEAVVEAAKRELLEETGLHADHDGLLTDLRHEVQYSIYPQWRHRYPPGTTHNTEHWFSFSVPQIRAVSLAQREHSQYVWLPVYAAAEKVFSPSNREAIYLISQTLKELPR